MNPNEINEALTSMSTTKEKVTFLTSNGHSVAQIAKLLGVSDASVSHHRRTKDNPGAAPRVTQSIDEAYLGTLTLGQKVGYLTSLGYSVAQISSRLQCSEGTVSYHRKNGTQPKTKGQILDDLFYQLENTKQVAQELEARIAELQN